MKPSSSARTEPAGTLLSLRILLFAAAVPVLLRRRPLADLPRSLEPRRPPRGEPTAARVEDLVARVDRVLRAAWPLVRRGCMTRGLTRYRFLRERGADVALLFGVRVGGDAPDGHCWIVYRGEPLAEPRDPRPLYTETWRIAPPAGGPSASGELAPSSHSRRRVPG